MRVYRREKGRYYSKWQPTARLPAKEKELEEAVELVEHWFMDPSAVPPGAQNSDSEENSSFCIDCFVSSC